MIKNKLVVLVFSIFILAGCSKSSSALGAAFFEQDYRPAEIPNENTIEQFGENVKNIQETSIRKLITNSNLQIRIENMDGGVNKLAEIMGRYGTYASSINIWENSREYTLRVPAAKYKNFLDEIMLIGNIIRFNETTEDVTLGYYDLESRLNTKRGLIITFQNYLGRANNIEEILSVEKRIAELQAEIDDIGRQFRLLNDLIDYSTIRLELLGPISVSNYGRETILERIKGLMIGFRGYVSTIVVALLAIVVYGIPAIIILLLLYLLLFGKIGILKKSFKFVSGKKIQKKIE
ncbi:MAG: DUF4349 domain-containing protein [Treponema sp.]|jgi:hypothetical protein|nr:DUF4349 domain-containing protein [Treponema sp.]